MIPRISSETARLQAVVVHTPGREVSLVDPAIREELLFDDIIYEDDARNEHLDMLSLFRTGMPADGSILEIVDLFKESLATLEQRERFTEHLVRGLPELNLHPVRDILSKLPADGLAEFVVAGRTAAAGGFTLPPLPNLLFTRDLAAVVGNRLILSSMSRPARKRESLIMEHIALTHPLFEPLRDRIVRIPDGQSVEGGDVLVASDNTLLVGMSERTTFGGLLSLADALLGDPVERIIAVDIPKRRSTMHLDTIFTFVDECECVVFTPVIEDTARNVVLLERARDGIRARLMSGLKAALEHAEGRPFHFIPCGGDDLTDQYREQWTDGANLFALAPGVVVGYERNHHTFNAMSERGYEILDQFEFTRRHPPGTFDPGRSGKMAVTFKGQELCRGRGGARCMTLPLLRTEIPPQETHSQETHSQETPNP